MPPKIDYPTGSPVGDISRGILQGTNADALDQARRIAGYAERAIARRATELAAEVAARNWVTEQYRGAAHILSVPRRGTSGPPIIDMIFQTGPGEYLVLEVKGGASRLS